MCKWFSIVWYDKADGQRYSCVTDDAGREQLCNNEQYEVACVREIG